MSNPSIDPVAVMVGAPQAGMPPVEPLEFSAKGSRIGSDLLLLVLTTASAFSVLVMLGSLLVVLWMAALPSIKVFGVKFLTSSDWRPNELTVPLRTPDGKLIPLKDANGKPITDDDDNPVMETRTILPSFGALPVIFGTTVSSFLALVIAVPISLGAAIFLIRIAPKILIPFVSFLIEFLAAIPSIAYGIWGLFVMTPFLQAHFEPWIHTLFGKLPMFGWLFFTTRMVDGHAVREAVGLTGRDMFAGGLVLAIMILPIITAISRDVLRQVPRAQVEGTVALGATWWQSTKEMLKFSRTGLFGAVMLGLARAAGETMAITMVIGNNNQIKTSLFAPAQTMSSLLANEFAEASTDLHRAALCEVALVLLLMSLIFNVVARYLVVGRSETRGAAAF